MDTQRLTSTEFRLVYARTEAITQVTVLGRAIGTWYPTGTEDNGRHAAALELAARGLEEEVARLKRELAARPMAGIKAVVPEGSATSVLPVPRRSGAATVAAAQEVRKAPTQVHVGTATYDSVPWKDRPATPAKK